MSQSWFLSYIICNVRMINILIQEGTKIVSADAVFGLCRKKSSGVSVRPPLFSGLFFESQSDVDQFVDNYDPSSHIMDKV